jgi:hypothetical protein
MSRPVDTLRFALERFPERVEVIPLGQLVTETARRNDRRPAWVKLALPDDLVKALRGAGPAGAASAEGDVALLVVVPREVAERQDSRIILPGEAR